MDASAFRSQITVGKNESNGKKLMRRANSPYPLHAAQEEDGRN